MHENLKLKEAEYFYSQMLKENNKYDYFTYNLSAFLSAARSVLQYALKEAKNKSEGQLWYKYHRNSSVYLKFFTDKRNFSIHQGPIKPSKHVKITVGPPILVVIPKHPFGSMN